MKLKHLLFIILIASLSIRLIFNFSWELIPGVNGGYYPLQVRLVLETGHLGFSDMPLLFYLDAFIIKIMSLFGFAVTDQLIINVVKLVDSVSLPLLLFPLRKLMSLYQSSDFIKLSIFSFSVLSFSPLILISDLQKNALAIVFIFGFLAYFLMFQINKSRKDFILSILFLLLTGLTHFGSFVFALFFLLISVLYIYRKKAILPSIMLIIVSLLGILMIDSARFSRLVTFWKQIFEKPALFTGMISLPDFIFILFSLFVAILGILVYRSDSKTLKIEQKAIFMASIISLLACSFPLMDGEYFRRLSLFLFIPQVLLIVQIASVSKAKLQKNLAVVLFVFTLLSIFAAAGQPKTPVVDKNAFADLKKLKPMVGNDPQTIVIARHGLEWWTAWTLHTKVGQDKAINESLFDDYQTVIFLNQIAGFNEEHHRTPFHEPEIAPNAEMVYASEYFRAYTIAQMPSKKDH